MVQNDARPSSGLSDPDVRALLDAVPGFGFAYEDLEGFLLRVLEFLRSRFEFSQAGVILSDSYEGIQAGSLPGSAFVESSLRRILEPGFAESPRRLELWRQSFAGAETTTTAKTGITSTTSTTSTTATPSADDAPAAAESSEWIARFQQEIRADGFELFFPVIFQHELIAVFFLGPRNSGLPYGPSDRLFLELGSGMFSLALRNAMIRFENARLRMAAPKNQGPSIKKNAKSASGNPKWASGKSLSAGGRTIVFSDSATESMLQRWARIGGPDLPVLITGETGTGKELLARWIHNQSAGEGPFVPVNCSSIPTSLWESELFGHTRGAFTDARTQRSGLVEMATGGTLFFDEIGDMPLDIQPKILRLMQEKAYLPLGSDREKRARCRMLFATHRDLYQMVMAGQFRQDLYYRICVVEETIAPLRNRPEDIEPLFKHFLVQYATRWKVAPAGVESDLMNAMRKYPWPGNVRELENFAARVALEYSGRSAPVGSFSLLGRQVASALPDPEEADSVDFESSVSEYSRRLIRRALQQSDGNRALAARMLGISRGRLNYQIRQLGIRP